jgi:hypothetical protein
VKGAGTIRAGGGRCTAPQLAPVGYQAGQQRVRHRRRLLVAVERSAQLARAMAGALARGALGWYTTRLTQQPLLTKTTTGLAMALAGDLVAQGSERPGQPVDVRRLAAFTAFGAAWTGPVNHYWLPIVARLPNLGTKLLVQHGLLNPLVYVPVFLTWNAMAQGKDWGEARGYVQERYTKVLSSVLVFWVPATAIVFARVPESLQSVTMAAISLVWNVALSFVSNSPQLPALQRAASNRLGDLRRMSRGLVAASGPVASAAPAAPSSLHSAAEPTPTQQPQSSPPQVQA